MKDTLGYQHQDEKSLKPPCVTSTTHSGDFQRSNAQSVARGSEAQVAKKYLSTLIGGKAMGCTKCDRGLNWERSHSSPSEK